MNRRTIYWRCLTAAAMTALPGSASTATVKDMNQTRPRRSSELARPSMFQDDWQGTGQARIAGLDQPLPVKGLWQASPDLDGWYLLTREDVETRDSGKAKGIGIC